MTTRARDFVPKPFDVERLLRIIDGLCGEAPDEGARNGSSIEEARSVVDPSS